MQAAGTLDGPQIATLTNTSGIRTVISPADSITPFTMRIDEAPFKDVRVRQAMRLLVDRQGLIDSALDGHGTIGNDIFSPYDPAYDHSLRRVADIPQAKFLLTKAGQEKLTVQLVTSAVSTGTVAMATVLAEQAKQAGVTIKLRDVGPSVFFGTGHYLNWAFSQDYYNYSPYLAQVSYSMLPTSPFNETHNNNPHCTALYEQANATLDRSAQRQIEHEMQKIDFTEGGYIIPAYIDSLDAYSAKITGYGAAKMGQPLSDSTSSTSRSCRRRDLA